LTALGAGGRGIWFPKMILFRRTMRVKAGELLHEQIEGRYGGDR
jgi:hypothetical protein